MQDKELAQHQVSMLLFVGLMCGIGMFLFTKFLGTQVLTGKTLKQREKERSMDLELSSCSYIHTSFGVLRFFFCF